MKKLVTAFALCAAVSAMAVESANVVGYQTFTAGAGYTALAPTFLKVGGAALTASDIKGDFAEFDSLQIFDDAGNVATELFWLVSGSFLPEESATGWYQSDFSTPAGDTVFTAGSAFWVNSASGASVTVAGQVNASSVVVNAGAGYTPTGNAMPKATTAGALQFTGLEEFDSLQIFDDAGNVATELFWLVSGSFLPEESATGWYQSDFSTPAGSTVLAAGSAFWINSAGGGVTMTIPSPL